MRASDIMTSPVITVGPEASLQEIAELLSERRISGVPVLEQGRLVGLVSEGDLLRRRELDTDQPPAAYIRTHARRARDVMTHEVMTVAPDTPVAKIAALLETGGIKRVPVLHEGRLVGIVSRSNLIQALAVRAPSEEVRRDDAEIRASLLAELQRQSWWRQAAASVIVSDGVVHYWGTFDSEEQRQAACVAAENIPGVRRVEDHRVPVLDLASWAPAAPARPMTEIRRASERGHSKHGRIDLYHSFSFGDYYDPAHMGYGPLRAINEECVQPGAGPTTYGLCDVEIITYILEGVLSHEDSTGDSSTMAPGGVRRISAGFGVSSSELRGSESGLTRFLQIWIEPRQSGIEPACEQRRFAAEEKRGRLRVIASPDGREDSLRINQDLVLYAGLFDGAERAELSLGSGRPSYVHVARGGITANGHALGAGDGLKSGGSVVLEGGEGAEVLVFDLPEGSSDHWRRRLPRDRRRDRGAPARTGRRWADRRLP